MVLLDVSEQNSVTIHLPYNRPFEFFDLSQPPDNVFWRIGIWGFHVGSIGNQANSITYKLYCRAVKPQAAGFLPHAVMQSAIGVYDPGARLRMATAAGAGFSYLVNKAVTSMYTEGVKNLEAGATELGSNAAKAAGEYIRNTLSSNPLADKGVATEPTVAPGENAKLDLVGNISAPAVSSYAGCTRLGDAFPVSCDIIPPTNNVYDLATICSVPVSTGSKVFLATTDLLDLTASPFPPASHSLYLSRMFRFYRSGSRIMLKFCCSQLVSTRFQISLFPVSAAATASFGDVPTWVVTVKGSMSWCIEVPYLYATAWRNIYDTDFPILRIAMIDPLPTVFGDDGAVFVQAFQCAAPDIKLAGLQSCVPSAMMQSLWADMVPDVTFGSMPPRQYQGGLDNVYQILSRFSSREPTAPNRFPFPLFIDNQAEFYELDNYDYVCQLYAFYSGESRVKIVFSKATADGLLQTTILNTETSALGDSFKAGNGLVVSHQSVWPMVEFTFPYQCETPFNSARYPVPMYTQFVSETNQISKYLIASADNFTLSHLLPVPDFFLLPPPAPPVAEMQSMPPFTLGGTVGFNNIVPGSQLLINANPSFSGRGTFSFSYSVDADPGDFGIWLLTLASYDAISPFPPTVGVGVPSDLSVVAVYGHVDAGGSYQGTIQGVCENWGTLYLNARLRTDFTGGFRASWFLRISPFSSLSTLTTSDSSSALAFPMQVEETSVVQTNLQSSSITLGVAVSNPIAISNVPLPVTATISDPSLDVNILGQPIGVSVVGTFPVTISGAVDVQGVASPTHPVWTSSYV